MGLTRCEDYDVYFRMAVQYRIASHHEVSALYRWHGQNVGKSRDDAEMVLRNHDRQKVHTVGDRALETERSVGDAFGCRLANEFANECVAAGGRNSSASTIRLALNGLTIATSVTLELDAGIHRAGRLLWDGLWAKIDGARVLKVWSTCR